MRFPPAQSTASLRSPPSASDCREHCTVSISLCSRYEAMSYGAFLSELNLPFCLCINDVLCFLSSGEAGWYLWKCGQWEDVSDICHPRTGWHISSTLEYQRQYHVSLWPQALRLLPQKLDCNIWMILPPQSCLVLVIHKKTTRGVTWQPCRPFT